MPVQTLECRLGIRSKAKFQLNAEPEFGAYCPGQLGTRVTRGPLTAFSVFGLLLDTERLSLENRATCWK
jgi:hypothetical protein